jgi:hypothetical protein
MRKKMKSGLTVEKESILKSKKGKLGEMSLRGKDMLRGSRHMLGISGLICD